MNAAALSPEPAPEPGSSNHSAQTALQATSPWTAERLTRPGEPAGKCLGVLPLPHDLRERSRLVAPLPGGVELVVRLPRHAHLAADSILIVEPTARPQGLTRDPDVAPRGHVRVTAQPERLSVVRCEEPLALARAAYHLGNRHVRVALAEGQVSYRQDSVLDDMLRKMGFNVESSEQPFHPEGGAYRGGHAH